MTIQIILFVAFGLVAIWMLVNPLNKKESKSPQVIDPKPLEETPEPTNKIDDPVKSDPEPTPIPIVPIDDEFEMPIKPLPVNCQMASFMPAPALFEYIDCCGNLNTGEGYQPWEKRSPVKIDANKPFEGMELLNQEAEIDC